jgi:hypothetical protein
MRFRIKGILTDVDVTSVTLEYNPNIIQNDSPEGLMLWHCPICTTPIFQFSGKLISITPGMVPSKLPPVIHQCPKCKIKYLVVTML